MVHTKISELGLVVQQYPTGDPKMPDPDVPDPDDGDD